MRGFGGRKGEKRKTGNDLIYYNLKRKTIKNENIK